MNWPYLHRKIYALRRVAGMATDRKTGKLTNFLICCVLIFASSNAAPWTNGHVRATKFNPSLKIDPWVTASAENGDTDFLVFLAEQADLSQAGKLETKLEKGEYVFKQLTETARRTQRPLLTSLKSYAASDHEVEFRSFWVVNAIWVHGGADLIQQLADLPDVGYIYANPSVKLEISEQGSHLSTPQQSDTVEWNIQKVRAPMVWDAGYTGQGVVVAGQDTGYDWDHPALKGKYRGWDGATVEHNYNWHDAIHTDDPHTAVGNPCGFNSPVPCDDNSHGTHTMGTMVGDDGTGNQVGIAPGARWVGCRNMEQGWGTPATYIECFEWFIAPTDLNGNNPKPSLAPDVINNSWRCPTSEGCTDPNILKAAVENVRAAGILTVQSAGNSGSACGSIDSPAGIYDASFTIGNTDSNDIIATNSSRGPVTVDGSNRMKPDVSAPGTNIRSSVPNASFPNSYSYMSGTSMAAPHAAGLTALLLSVRPDLRGDPDALEALIRFSAVPRTTNQECGGVPGSKVPNNTYGWGRIDAWNLYNMVTLQISKSAAPSAYNPKDQITFTLTVTNTNVISPTFNVVITDVIPAGTQFITATLPHTRTGEAVVWGVPTLDANQSTAVKLVVEVNDPAPASIVNMDYSGISDDKANTSGNPLHLYRIINYYFPLIIELSDPVN